MLDTQEGNTMSKKIKKLVERIGLDRMVIAGFRILHIDFEKLKKHQNITVEEQENLHTC